MTEKIGKRSLVDNAIRNYAQPVEVKVWFDGHEAYVQVYLGNKLIRHRRFWKDQDAAYEYVKLHIDLIVAKVIEESQNRERTDTEPG